MVLLTSGQVSFAISSFIVFLFTLALFLSGYAIQQQTVRDLRAAIKPKEVPKQARLFLPPQFAAAKPSPKEKGRDSLVVEVKQSKTDAFAAEKNENKMQGKVEDLGLNQKPIAMSEEKKLDQTSDLYDLPLSSDPEPAVRAAQFGEEKPLSRAERRRRIKEEIMAGSEEAGFKGYRRRMW